MRGHTTTNHPARVAERVSTLDLVSNGRVELGLGEGSSVTELHPFERKFREKRAVWEDAVRATLPMFWEEGWEYHGEYFDFPLRNVIPKPRQQPHPPLWVACSQMETIRMAGQRGMGALGFSFVNAESARAWCHAYYNEFVHRQEKLCNYQTNANIAVVAPFMCCETDEEAQQKMDGWSFFQFALLLYNKEGPFKPGTVNLWERYEDWKKNGDGRKIQPNSGLVGSPATIRERLHQFVKQFGYGTATGVEVPAETRGRVAPVDKWTPDSVASVSIGYEISVTSLQSAAAYGAVANDGVRVRPHLIKEITEEYNITTVINTHDMNSVMEIGEKILFLKDG